MLMEVKKEFKIYCLSIKYSLMKEMLNKITFLSNIIFMILNNASFIIEWIILFSLKDNIGGYDLKMVLILWGLASSTFGFSRFFFKNAFYLSETINDGKLDSYLVLPKNVLISVITSNIDISAIGDMLYGYIMLLLYGLNIKTLSLFTLFMITGGLILTSVSVILSSLSFWFGATDTLTDMGNSLMINFATYPDSIFKGLCKILLYTIIPAGLSVYLPIKIITNFNIISFFIVILFTIIIISLAVIIFNKGLKKYSSSNLMIMRI